MMTYGTQSMIITLFFKNYGVIRLYLTKTETLWLVVQGDIWKYGSLKMGNWVMINRGLY